MTVRIEIEYCTGCKWLLRGAWVAQEILSTFEAELDEVALVPGKDGIFQVRLADTLIWCRKRDQGFPQPKELKQRIRDLVAKDRDLGHIDETS
ncbi:MAG: SelT/selW/selH selenoprotein [Myxococcales bacterium]|nr:SelT/selW/selH selenoprotein [Myxococcales bacterium]